MATVVEVQSPDTDTPTVTVLTDDVQTAQVSAVGPQGPAATVTDLLSVASMAIMVTKISGSWPARPAGAGTVLWVGDSQPSGWLTGDLWLVT